MRDARFHEAPPTSETEPRSAFQRDRDRILYSSAFRRLAGVTQVVGASEGFIFHNRLTHSLKVAQLGRRIAEKLIREQPELAAEGVPVDPDVVEAAGLAHDLGHPPFGHVAEMALKEAAASVTDFEAFEGNPQSFRIVTKLSMRSFEHDGLNLTPRDAECTPQLDGIDVAANQRGCEGTHAVTIDPEIEQEVNLLKELTWVYVIRNPALATQQWGQKRLIRWLFDTFREATEEKEPNVFPLSTRDQLLKLRVEGLDDDSSRTRLVVDLIASMTEGQALEMYQKLSGFMPGSGLDLLLHQSIS